MRPACRVATGVSRLTHRSPAHHEDGNPGLAELAFDIVVIGAGSAGCAAAARLSEDPGLRVALVESGPDARHLMVRVPVAWPSASRMDRFGWGYATEPEPETMGRAIDQPRGRLLGGTSSINGMMYSRGNRQDYDDWAAAGLPGWSYAEILPYFLRSEANWRGAGPFHGEGGPVAVTRNARHPQLYPVMVETARELGLAENPDFNGACHLGFGMPDFTVRRGKRVSGWSAYVAPILQRPNLAVIKDAHVLRIGIHKQRATGVDLFRAGRTERIAAGEVILAAGTFNSPQLLMLSGIGDPDALQLVGVEAIHPLRAVGQNLQDHPLVASIYRPASALGFDRQLRLDRLFLAGLRWTAGLDGPLSRAPLSIQGYLSLLGSSERADVQFQVSHASFAARPWFPGWRRGAGDAFTVAAMQLRPTGRGSVQLKSADPFVPPAIRLGLLSTDADRDAARRMLAFSRRFFATSPLVDLVDAEILPGPDIASDDAVDRYLAQNITTGMHPVGTCAMGTDPERSVVDSGLRVHGIEGLRVADASIMPRIISGNTSAPAMMIGEKVADLVLGRQSPPAGEAG